MSATATDDQIRQAWRMLAMKWHPDRNPRNRKQAEKMLVQINRAYAVLKTKPQRDAYNRHLNRQRMKTKRMGSQRKPRPIFSALREIFWPFALKETTRHG